MKRPRSVGLLIIIGFSSLFGCEQEDHIAQLEAMNIGQPSISRTSERAHESREIRLDSVGRSGVTGTARLTQDGDNTSVAVHVFGLRPGTYPVHLHWGLCGADRGVAQPLQDVVTDGSNGKSVTAIDHSLIPHSSLAFIQVHAIGDGPIACGNLPESPSAGES